MPALSRLALPAVVVSSLAVALLSWRFLGLGLDAAFPSMAGHLADRPAAFLLHVLAGPVALALGALQLVPRIRATRPGLHRQVGRCYALACCLGGLAGLVLAPGAEGGALAGTGFGALALVWIGTTLRGWQLARAGDRAGHRRWMIRSFALTFAAVTLRLQLPVLMGAGLSYPEASVFLAWSCWLPNLLLAEALLARRPRPAAVPG